MSNSHQTAVYRGAAFRGHDTGDHPENPSRMLGIERARAESGLLAGRPSQAWAPATREQLARVHDERYLDRLERITDFMSHPDLIFGHVVFPSILSLILIAVQRGEL